MKECEFADTQAKTLNGCKILNDYVRCNPETCIWHKTHNQYIDELVEAVLKWQKNHDRMHWQTTTIVPDRYRDEVRTILYWRKYGGTE